MKKLLFIALIAFASCKSTTVIDTAITAEVKTVALSYSNKGIYKVEACTTYPQKVKWYTIYTDQPYAVGEKIVINTTKK